MHRLITIPFSHYNEKARWGLDRFGVPYREERYMPGFQMLPVLVATRGRGRFDAASTPFSTPVLVTDAGKVLCDSHDILKFVCDRYGNASTTLYPSGEVAALESYFHDELGPHARRVAYAYGLPDRTILFEAASHNVGHVQQSAIRLLRPVLTHLLRWSLSITPDRAARSLTKIRRVFDDVGKQVEGKKFLVGDRFTAADLSFAALASPVLLVQPEEGFGAWLPPLSRAAKPWADVATELRATPAGAFALRMYREERTQNASSDSNPKADRSPSPVDLG